MKTKLLFSAIFTIVTIFVQAQEKIFATTSAKSAIQLKEVFPDTEILATKDLQSAVIMSRDAANYLHKNVVTHGPGYVYKSTKAEAIASISREKKINNIVNFTINQDAVVNNAISKVNAENIKAHIQTLENYGTRFHTSQQAKTAIQDLKTKWQNMITASGRSDISVRIVNHTGTTMPSLILTIAGEESPSEFVIVGAHMDSISNTAQAPGADDDASGIATITEIIRILIDTNFHPQKTVEFMAFAAEEIGLVGSSEISADYANESRDVISFVQFDMTNYNGSTSDIYFTDDYYNSTDLNLFLIELITHYNSAGIHKITYGTTTCDYGCSDHYSWAENGYDAAFPFEASFTQYNPYIHSSNDKLSKSGNTATHAAKFAKLGLEFIIETSKTSGLAVKETKAEKINMYIDNGWLNYNTSEKAINRIQILDISGKQIFSQKKLLAKGKLNVSYLTPGFYLAIFENNDGQLITKKFIIN